MRERQSQQQKVIITGSYAIVRHPMYVDAFLTYAFTPLALGSYWAFIPGVMILPVLVFRILSERYRNRRKRFGLRFNLIASLYNLELK